MILRSWKNWRNCWLNSEIALWADGWTHPSLQNRDSALHSGFPSAGYDPFQPRDENIHGYSSSRAGPEDLQIYWRAARKSDCQFLSGWRNASQNRREYPWSGCLYCPADLPADESELDGTPDSDRCGPAGERLPDHCGHPLFWLRPAGS